MKDKLAVLFYISLLGCVGFGWLRLLFLPWQITAYTTVLSAIIAGAMMVGDKLAGGESTKQDNLMLLAIIMGLGLAGAGLIA